MAPVRDRNYAPDSISRTAPDKPVDHRHALPIKDSRSVCISFQKDTTDPDVLSGRRIVDRVADRYDFTSHKPQFSFKLDNVLL